MKDKEADTFISVLSAMSTGLTEDRVEWIAISIAYKDGGRIIMHSKDAPRRPKGLADE